ncbi:hypothetical protein GQ457_11G028050 [Hibiscus cannabinus]
MADSLLAKLGDLTFTAEEQDAIVVAPDSVAIPAEDFASLLVGKVVSPPTVDCGQLIRQFRSIWKDDKVLTISEINPNFFLISFASPANRANVLKRGPWDFQKYWFALEQADPNRTIPNYSFLHMCIWVRIHNIPLSLMTATLARVLGASIGKVIMTDTRLEDGNMGEFMWVRVLIDTSKPLRRCVVLSRPDAKASMCPLQYERLPLFCHGCGLIGHPVLACPTTPKRSTTRPRGRLYVIDDDLDVPISVDSATEGPSARPGSIGTNASASTPDPVVPIVATPAVRTPPPATDNQPDLSAPLGKDDLVGDALDEASPEQDASDLAADRSFPDDAPYDPMVHNETSDMLEEALEISRDCVLLADLTGVIQADGEDLVNEAIPEAADSIIREIAASILGVPAPPDAPVVPSRQAPPLSASPSKPGLSKSALAGLRRTAMPVVPEHHEFDERAARSRTPPAIAHNQPAEARTSSIPPPRPHKRQASSSDPSRAKLPPREMRILCWNCQGLGKAQAVRSLARDVTRYSVDFIFLSETRLRMQNATFLRSVLGFKNCFFVDAGPGCTGLAIFWNNNIKVDLLSYSALHIDVLITYDSSTSFRFTGMHGRSESSLMKHNWALIDRLREASPLPWLLGGDFNEILTLSEKQGGNRKPHHQLTDFRECLIRNNLTDCKPSQGWFTWLKSGPRSQNPSRPNPSLCADFSSSGNSGCAIFAYFREGVSELCSLVYSGGLSRDLSEFFVEIKDPNKSLSFSSAASFPLSPPLRLWKILAKRAAILKVRSFGWHCGREALLVGSRLRDAGFSDGAYPLCGAGLEDVLHVLLDCPDSLAALRQAGFVDSLLSADWATTVDWASIFFFDWMTKGMSRQETTGPALADNFDWDQISVERSVKINVDGAFLPSARHGAIGVISRDSSSAVLGGFAKPVPVHSHASTVEVSALFAGLEFAISNGWASALIESDAAVLVNKLHRPTMDLSLLGICLPRPAPCSLPVMVVYVLASLLVRPTLLPMRLLLWPVIMIM